MHRRIQIWLNDNGYGELVRAEALGGGCINDVQRLHLQGGETLVAKQHESAPPGMFLSEAAGLKAMAATGTLRIPELVCAEEDFILLEDLGQGKPADNYWQALGTGLADLHTSSHPQFGFIVDNYCGSTPQLNTMTEDGFEFFANYRILSLASQAFQRQLLDRSDLDGLDYIASHLQQWIPRQEAVLLHGDLWSGNIHCDEQGLPALIDPACYYGWAEADLAMTQLFGGFNEVFYESYCDQARIDETWRQRTQLYNLYHLLNHLLLFGGSYLGPIRDICKRYAGS